MSKRKEKIDTDPGDRLLLFEAEGDKRKGTIIHTSNLGKGRVEVVKARK